MVLSERWRVSDDDLLEAIEAMRKSDAAVAEVQPQVDRCAPTVRSMSSMAACYAMLRSPRPQAVSAENSAPYPVDSPPKTQAVKMQSLPMIARVNVPQLGQVALPTVSESTEKRSVLKSEPKAVLPQIHDPYLLPRDATIPDPHTGRRQIGAPSKHIQIHVYIPDARVTLSLWLDPDFPIRPPPAASEQSVLSPRALLLPSSKTSKPKEVSPMADIGMVAAANSKLKRVAKQAREHLAEAMKPVVKRAQPQQTPHCLQHILEDFSGIPVWEQSLQAPGLGYALKKPGATLRDCHIAHGFTITLATIKGVEGDARRALHGIGTRLRQRFPSCSFRDEVLQELAQPMLDSHEGYQRAMDQTAKAEPKGPGLVEALKRMDDELCHKGRLVVQTKLHEAGQSPDVLLQPQNKREDLLRAAEEAQNTLRRIVAAAEQWTKVKASSSTSEEDAADDDSGHNIMQTTQSRFADLVVDPGMKSERRIDEKVKHKYAEKYGLKAYARMRDVCRMAFQYKTCSKLLNGVNQLRRNADLEVVTIENRFSKPTALGWRDMTVLAKIPLANGQYHIAEIQLCLVDLWEARNALHSHYEKIRVLLPKACGVPASDMANVQVFLLDELQSMQRPTAPTAPTKPALKCGRKVGEAPMSQQLMKRAKENCSHQLAWIQPQWQHSDSPRFFAEPERGNRRKGPQPEPQVSITRQPWTCE